MPRPRRTVPDPTDRQPMTCSTSVPLTIEPFDENGNVLQWAADYEDAGHLRGWSDGTLAHQLIGYVAGTVRDWLRNLKVRKPLATASWSAVKEEMLRAFSSDDFRFVQRRKLAAPQGRDESVIGFFDRKLRLGLELGLEESEVAEWIRTTLSAEYGSRLKDGPLDLDQLREKLRTLWKPATASKTSADGKVPVKATEPRREGVMTRNIEQAERQRKRECYHCGKPGHVARDCRVQSAPPQWPAKKVATGVRGDRPGIPSQGDGKEVNATVNKSLLKQYPKLVHSFIVNNIEVKGLLDTGADVTCVDDNFFERSLNHRAEYPSKIREPITGAGGYKLRTRGTVVLRIEYVDRDQQSQEVQEKAVVVEQLGQDLILGHQFLRKTGFRADFGSGAASFGPPNESPQVMQTMQGPVVEDKLSPQEDGTTKFNGELGPDIWGQDYQLPGGPFADDHWAERVSPYVFWEKTEITAFENGEIAVGAQLSEEERRTLKKTLSGVKECFSFSGELGECTVLAHEIRTGNARPIHEAPYARAKVEREAVDQQVQEWLRQGVIRPSQSPWSSRVVTVLKKDNTTRCCVDYRRLNAVTERDQYPMPTRDEIFASLAGMKVFSSLDLNQGYMQIRMYEPDIPKTAFVVQSGFYEFTRMPFGLSNAPATFQRLMDHVLAGLKWSACLVYLDDVIVFGRCLEDHNRNLLAVLLRLREAGLTVKPSKLALAVEELRFLGHIVSGEGVRMDPEKVKAVQECPAPKDVREVRSFVGLASYYRMFVEGFASIAEPLTRLTKKDTPFVWSTEQQVALDELKRRITTQPIMCHFDHSVPVELRTDASGYGLGAILLHVFPDRRKRVIEYASRLLKKEEKNYGISEKECLAIVWAITKYRTYLMGVKFTVVTDHLALVWLKSKRDLPPRLMRWANILQPYHFEIIYKSGKLHRDVDHLSRYPVEDQGIISVDPISYGRRGTNYRDQDGPQAEPAEEVEEVMGMERDELRQAQSEDETCQELLAHIEESREFAVEEGLVVQLDRHDGRAEVVTKLVIPDSLLNRVLYGLHDDPLSGHGGARKTLWRFKQRYYTHNAGAKVKAYVQSCHLCQTRKHPWTKKIGKLHPLEPAVRPFERVGLDTLGPFRRSQQGNVKIIVATDYMTRWSIAKAVPRENAGEIAHMLIHEIILKHGTPESILSDRGKSFRTEMMRELYREFDIRHVTATAYHPQTNGLAERMNKTLAVMMSMYVNQHHRNWDEFLPYVVFAYNSTVQDSTGYSPFYLLYGFEARLTTDLGPQPEQTVSGHFEKLHHARERAVEASAEAQLRQKEQYDKDRFHREYTVGDLVLVFRPRGYSGQTTKLRHPFEGPFKVVQKHNDLNYLVREVTPRGKRGREELVHVSRLKAYVVRERGVTQGPESTESLGEPDAADATVQAVVRMS